METSNIVAVGMSTFDELIILHSYPLEDQKYMADNVVSSYGGMAANVAINLSHLNHNVALLSAVGDDYIGKDVFTHLSKERVNISGVRIIKGYTTKVYIIINSARISRTAIANQGVTISSLDEQQRNLIQDAKLVYLDGSVKSEIVTEILREVDKTESKIFFNLETYTNTQLDLFQQCDYGVMDEGVASSLSSGYSFRALLKKLWRKENSLKGITCGKKGSLFYNGEEYFASKSYKVDEVDTTGAGDAFQSGIVLGIIKGWDIEFTLKVASVIAGLSCTAIGAHTYRFDLEHILGIVRNLDY